MKCGQRSENLQVTKLDCGDFVLQKYAGTLLVIPCFLETGRRRQANLVAVTDCGGRRALRPKIVSINFPVISLLIYIFIAEMDI